MTIGGLGLGNQNRHTASRACHLRNMQDPDTPSGESVHEAQGRGFPRTRRAPLKSLGSRRHACDRCRRQKLKCDVEKPCSLCLRSGFRCETTSAPLRKSKRSAKDVDARRRSVQHIGRPTTSRSNSRALDTRSLNQARTDAPDTGNQPGPLQQPHRYVQASAVELTDELFHLHDQGSANSPTTHSNTSALPGGTFLHSRISGDRDDGKTSLSSLFPGLVVPSRAVCDSLLQSYWRSAHWFMILFYKPSFEREYRQIIGDQHVATLQRGTAVLILMVLAIGARYASDEERSKVGISKEELSSLQRDLLDQIRLHYFDVLDTGAVECVQLCILLSTYYLYNGMPNLALPILGAGIHSAQAQGLHKESLWGSASEIVLEVRKRTWWALYVLDRFASMTYGRPPLVNDDFCAVSMPRDMDDILTVHPLLSHAGHPPTPVTLGSYQRHKFSLYTIANLVVRNIHNVHVSSSETAINQAAEINTRLVDWFDQLPVELRLEHNVNLDLGSLTSAEAEVCQLFQLQALALQLAYDNIQILLHRPFIQCARRLPVPTSSDLTESDGRPTSFEQCKHSARRTCSILPRCANLLHVAQMTHAAVYIAIQNFTAGVTMAMVALSDPGSEQSLDAKRGVANSIKLQKTLAASSIVPSQTVRVLEGLFQLMFKREMQSLLGNPPLELDCPSPLPYQARQPHPSDIVHVPMERQFTHRASRGAQDNPELLSSIINPNDHTAMNPDLAQDAPGLSFYPGIGQALESVQQVLWENSDPTANGGGHGYVPGTYNPQHYTCEPPGPFVGNIAEETNRFPQPNPPASMADPDPASQDLNILNTCFLSQSWLWNQPDFDGLREL